MLGDFHYKGTKQAYDYTYDGDGNLTKDNNKAIDTIFYNYLNLPQQVHMKGEGNIFYTYDATGNKLQKQTIDSAAGVATTTLYLDGFQYQRRTPIANPGSGIDTLQFIGHEEGRARWAFHKYLNGDSAYAWEYDFVEKDHLGNTRVLLSQEKDTAQYMATMEAAFRTTEDALFYNIDSTSYARASVPGYPVDVSVTNPNDSVARVNGNGPKVGPAIILKVMAGDKVDLGVQYYYNSMSNSNGPSLTLQNLLNSLASGLATLSAPAHGAFTTLSDPNSSPLLAALTSSIDSQDAAGTGKPQAYLNWVLLDDQFNYVGGNNQSGALQVGPAGTQSNGQLQPQLAYAGLPITKSGYLYIYVSNATPGWDVFFDNLSVKHYSGPLTEEDHYYPFGLTMAGISDKAIKTQYAENKYRFNKGSELQNKEFSDGSGLEIYETKLRELDPQLGRWWQADPKTDQDYESVSPYSAMNNDPDRYNDPNGDEASGCCDLKGAWNAIKDFGVDLYNTAVGDARVINTYANPATPFVELATGKSVESDFSADKSRTTSAVEAGITLIPLGKVAGAVAKVGEKVFEKAGEEAAEKTAEKTVGENARFIVEKDGTTVDTKTTPRGSYEQPDGGRTDVLQDKSHFNKTTQENVGQSHTHEPYSNTNPETGETRTGADRNNAHRPTYEEVRNIETGKAKKTTN